jgi:CRP-like cAMP-binding protein
MSLDDDIALLTRVPTLSLLGDDVLRILAIGAENRYVHDGDELFHEGDAADGAFLVQEGSFRLTSDHVGGVEPINVGPGTLLGDVALVVETVWPVSAVASEPSAVMRIPRKLFLKTLEGYPDAALRLRQLISVRAEQALRDIGGVKPFLAGSGGEPH